MLKFVSGHIVPGKYWLGIRSVWDFGVDHKKVIYGKLPAATGKRNPVVQPLTEN